MKSAQYVQSGKWTQCLWCGTLCKNLSYDAVDNRGEAVNSLNSHYCGAPWQPKPDDIGDAEWTVPNKELIRKHYPDSPYIK